MNYGIPYQGSKSKIIKKLGSSFPKATNFYDLFGGGFSVTHYMLIHRSNHYQKFHFNEIRQGMEKLILDAINGRYNYDVFRPSFVTREEFFKNKETCLYTKLLWSFGNNGKDYLFGKDIENRKKSLHNAVIFNQFNQLATKVLGIKRFNEGIGIKDRRLFVRHKARQLEQLERLQQLQQLEQLQQLQFTSTDYRHVAIKEDSIIYCDIPYRDTVGYDGNRFCHEDFYEWAASHKESVYISEYAMPDKRFKKILEIKTHSRRAGTGTVGVTEKVFCNDVAYKRLLKIKKEAYESRKTNQLQTII